MNDNASHELGWDDEIEDRSPIIPEGEYNFTVESLERGRFMGSDKLSSCLKATLRLGVDTPDGHMTTFCQLLLHKKLQFRLAQFFRSIGLQPNPDTGKIKPNWDIVPGATGRCKIKIRTYTDKSGNEQESNDVDFLEPVKHAASKNASKWGAF